MSDVSIFDHKSVKNAEAKQTIVGIFMHSKNFNKDIHEYLSRGAAELNRLTGKNIEIFFLETPHTSRERSVIRQMPLPKSPEFRVGYMTAFSEIQNPSFEMIDVEVREVEVLAALGDHFIESEFWRLPCLVFFPHFNSRDVCVCEFSDATPQDVANFILKCSSKASEFWKNRASTDDASLHRGVREAVFLEFEAFLKREKFKGRVKKIVANSTVLAIATSLVGLA